MPFREKTAWAMALILIGGAAFYLYMIISASRALGQTAPPIVGFVIAYVVVIVIASVILMAALAATSRARRTRLPTSARRSSVTRPATGPAM